MMTKLSKYVVNLIKQNRGKSIIHHPQSSASFRIPSLMYIAMITLILKPNKDATRCNYRNYHFKVEKLNCCFKLISRKLVLQDFPV